MTLARTDPPAARADGGSFHPLEIIPFFRRWPCTWYRDLAYTFIWNCLFALGFIVMGGIGAGALPSGRSIGMTFLIANFCGYTIHGLFEIGERTGLQRLVLRIGIAAKVVYFAAVPMLGVVLGFTIAAAALEHRFFDWMARPSVLFSILSTSLVISLVLTIIFFWRERSAVAEAEVAVERARGARIEREAALANLRALQAQIEPHFLFNTLANVASLIDPDPAKAKHMLENFIRFLRASLAATRGETTTLGEEAELIAAYLDVLQVRMGTRLRYVIDIPAELRAVAIPPMLLQPIVENAIRHGLEPKVEGGTVALRARREAGEVAVEIADTGVGFAPVTRGGVGLSNLRERLKLLYPNRASLTIADNTGGGARVTLAFTP